MTAAKTKPVQKARNKKRRHKFTHTEQTRREALDRAENGASERNYDALFAGFEALGISPDIVIPRENVFTYRAWQALGRQVKKGAKGVQLPEVFIPVTKKDEDHPNSEKKKQRFMRMKSPFVFHSSQTEPMADWTGKVWVDQAGDDDDAEEDC